jgi:hypothetical protein
MAEYKIYDLDTGGHIKAARWIEAGSDSAALEAARRSPFTHDQEVWVGTRKVARIAATTLAYDRET